MINGGAPLGLEWGGWKVALLIDLGFVAFAVLVVASAFYVHRKRS